MLSPTKYLTARSLTIWAVGLTGLTLMSCATIVPPPELDRARAAVMNAQGSQAAKHAPEYLVNAVNALARAEKAFVDAPTSPITADLAYVAERKAQLAVAYGTVALAVHQEGRAQDKFEKVAKEEIRGARKEARTAEEIARLEQEARKAAEARNQQLLGELQALANVKNEPRGLVITLSGSLLFATNQAVLLPAAEAKLADIAKSLIQDKRPIMVEGHTDSQGSDSHNMDLSRRRAEAVRSFLVSRGVPADRARTSGFGPSRPVADNKSAEGRAENRRVEIVLEGTHASR